MAEEAKDELSAAVAVLTQMTAEIELQQAVVDAKRAEQQQEEETVAPPSPPPRTESTSSETGPGSSGRRTRAQREEQGVTPTPKDSREYKEERDAAVSKLAQVNECTRSSLDYLF